MKCYKFYKYVLAMLKVLLTSGTKFDIKISWLILKCDTAHNYNYTVIYCIF